MNPTRTILLRLMKTSSAVAFLIAHTYDVVESLSSNHTRRIDAIAHHHAHEGLVIVHFRHGLHVVGLVLRSLVVVVHVAKVCLIHDGPSIAWSSKPSILCRLLLYGRHLPQPGWTSHFTLAADVRMQVLLRGRYGTRALIEKRLAVRVLSPEFQQIGRRGKRTARCGTGKRLYALMSRRCGWRWGCDVRVTAAMTSNRDSGMIQSSWRLLCYATGCIRHKKLTRRGNKESQRRDFGDVCDSYAWNSRLCLSPHSGLRLRRPSHVSRGSPPVPNHKQFSTAQNAVSPGMIDNRACLLQSEHKYLISSCFNYIWYTSM